MGGDDDCAADGGDGPDAMSTNRQNGQGQQQQQQQDETVVIVDPRGDVILDVTFYTSAETLRKSRKAALATSRKAGSTAASRGPASTSVADRFKAEVTVRYRVGLASLCSNSKYFGNLLTNSQFREAKSVTEAHGAIAARGQRPGEAEASDLPRIAVSDDDDATASAGREVVFEDMLRIMHGQPPAGAPSPNLVGATMSYVTTLAITADRFDCTACVSRCVNTTLKFKWPVTSGRPMRDDSGHPTDVEGMLRQKILVAWLLGQPMRLHNATRELIMRGSSRWSPYFDGQDGTASTAAWWALPDGLEHELQFRRECVLNTIASVPRHFLRRYSSRDRQCKLGYDSSAACDSFQLGQLLRFLLAKELLFLVDFSPGSVDAVPDAPSTVDVDEVLAALRQCPAYQVDKHHTNCGPRLRIDPVLDYFRTALSANALSVPLAEWKRRRADVSWVEGAAQVKHAKGDEDDNSNSSRVFAFTRALANDQRLRYEGAMYADRMARKLFTATEWDWTPEM
ncbi:hypothetical protein GMORB2_0138 [Geosmithia morbida]|uniref:Uncharacterized protein n=1 Tax=Geosmithia morbida TaxID=1094350 RepID=A0A9P4Z1H6_9HYPO|nr:uncharacterized protein GMORB2_0138 [Geosmithia morbida]KAF4126402.1 hypothetical protein GMORB2_0138 [Geosmithia morbida]